MSIDLLHPINWFAVAGGVLAGLVLLVFLVRRWLKGHQSS